MLLYPMRFHLVLYCMDNKKGNDEQEPIGDVAAAGTPVADAKMPNSRGAYLQITIGIIFSLLTTLSMAGYQALLPILEDEGVYSWLCAAGEETCDTQNLRLDLMMTLALSAATLCATLCGFSINRFGPARTCQVSAILFSVACITFAFSSRSFPLWIPAYVLLGCSGMGISFSMYNLSLLGHARTGLILTLVNGAVDSSSVVMVLFQVLHDHAGASLKTMFLAYAGVPLLLAILSKWIFHGIQLQRLAVDEAASTPSTAVVDVEHAVGCETASAKCTAPANESAIDAANSHGENVAISDCEVVPDDVKVTVEIVPAREAELRPLRSYTSWRRAIRDPFYWLMTSWVAINSCSRYFYIINAEAELTYAANGDEDRGEDGAFVFSIMLPAAVLLSPLTSHLLDGFRVHVILWVQAILSVVTGVAACIQSFELQYVTMVLVVFNRLCLWATATFMFKRVFGPAGLGMIYGTAQTIGGIYQLSNYLWTYISQSALENDWLPMNLFVSIMSSVVGVLLALYFMKVEPSRKHRST